MILIEGPWASDREAVVQRDPLVRQSWRMVEAVRERLLASIVGTGGDADTAAAGRVMSVLAQVTVIAENDTDSARARYGLISQAEADRRIAARDAVSGAAELATAALSGGGRNGPPRGRRTGQGQPSPGGAARGGTAHGRLPAPHPPWPRTPPGHVR